MRKRALNGVSNQKTKMTDVDGLFEDLSESRSKDESHIEVRTRESTLNKSTKANFCNLLSGKDLTVDAYFVLMTPPLGPLANLVQRFPEVLRFSL